MNTPTTDIRHYRTLWISDTHLGCRDCKAELLLEFLTATRSDTLYLLGDIIDLWALKRQVYWPASHQRVLDAITQKARQGTRVIYIPGNHDYPLRNYIHEHLFGVQIARRYVHMTAKGQRLLLLHGDEFDAATRFSYLNRWIGDFAYDLLLWLNRTSNFFRRLAGKPYWSLAGWLKQRVSKARHAIAAYEAAAIEAARQYPADGIVCGHIHQPMMRDHGGTLYINDGDWIESCTASAETGEGDLVLIHWADERRTPASAGPTPKHARQPATELPVAAREACA